MDASPCLAPNVSADDGDRSITTYQLYLLYVIRKTRRFRQLRHSGIRLNEDGRWPHTENTTKTLTVRQMTACSDYYPLARYSIENNVTIQCDLSKTTRSEF